MDGISSGNSLQAFSKAQSEKVDAARVSAAAQQPQAGGDTAGATAQSVGGAQGAQAGKYPPL